jgi:LCP family protein required for cell wall assembly
MKNNKKPPKPDFVYDPVNDKGKEAEVEPKEGSHHRKAHPSSDPDFVFDPQKTTKDHIRAEQEAELVTGRLSQHHKEPKDMTDEFDLPKRKKRRWPKVLLVIVLLLAVGLGVSGWYFLKHAGKVSTNLFDFSQLKGESRGRVNILLLGIGDPGHEGAPLSDTNMVISLDTSQKPAKVAMISIPRDLQVSIPGHGQAKINEANSFGGVDLAKQTVSNTLGIPIDYYVVADFSGLKQAVDAVGGIDIHNDTLLSDPEYPCDNNQYRSCGYKLAVGNYHLDGTAALKFARCRKGTCGDDFGRAQRQQQVLTAIREKALSANTLANPLKVNDLLNAASNNVKTDLSLKNIQRLGDLTKGLDKSQIMNIVFSLKPNGFLETSKSGSNLIPIGGDFDAIQKFVQNIFKFGPIWTEEPTVTIENGTTTSGLGGKFKSKLEDEGVAITISNVGNAKTRDFMKSQIIDYTSGKKPNTATYLAQLLGVEVTQPTTPVKNPVVNFEIILGNDYAASITTSTKQSIN